MGQTAVSRRRPKIGATVDPLLLGEVDRWVRNHPAYDRSKVIDEALRLWYAREQERAMVEQYTSPSGVDPEEWAAMKSIQRAAAIRMIQRTDRD